MSSSSVNIGGIEIPVYSYNTVILGSGAAGLNCADHLYDNGQKDIAIATENVYGGTSRNAGSDKQTYYKISTSGGDNDSPLELAQTLFSGGCMHGDLALVEATLSGQEFFHLVRIGVPFPHDTYGGYVGYKTDHDPRRRATSAGPLTSKYMHECLLSQIKAKGISIFDRHEAISLLRHEDTVAGLLAINRDRCGEDNYGLTLFNATSIVFATGGPAAIYKASVYPPEQKGSIGLALEIGAKVRNLAESQFGLASIRFRWNVSGTYQQVIPNYISTDKNGKDEKEFLTQYFPSVGKLATAIFLKGYQWPFDSKKIVNYGSSLIDLLVYQETVKFGRRVFMDFKRNPTGFRSEDLEPEAYTYLEKSGALVGSPIDRLKIMNPPAIQLYADHGIDLTTEPLEVAVCAQHNNGGLVGNIWWESNIKHLFPIGEVSGVHGVYRPGGSSLATTQVGGFRAAQFIAAKYAEKPPKIDEFLKMVKSSVEEKIRLCNDLVEQSCESSRSVEEIKEEIQERMTTYGAHVRSIDGVRKALREAYKLRTELKERLVIRGRCDVVEAFKVRDMVNTHIAYLEAIRAYLENNGGSRGSYVVLDPDGINPSEKLGREWCFKPANEELYKKICEVRFDEKMNIQTKWEDVRPIPSEEGWFENVWRDYREGKIIK